MFFFSFNMFEVTFVERLHFCPGVDRFLSDNLTEKSNDMINKYIMTGLAIRRPHVQVPI